MCDPDFWTLGPEAMELTLQGSRLIFQELADVLHRWWRRSVLPYGRLGRLRYPR